MKRTYSVLQSEVDGVEVVRLSDDILGVEVAVVPGIGNMAYELMVEGRNYLWFPFESPAELRLHPALCGIPLLAPWANRIDGDSYWVNGRQYRLNPELGNIRRDSHQRPIHGLLNFSPLWRHVVADAGPGSAWTTSRLEFATHPELMAQFPFAHTLTITHRLANGALEVETTIDNHTAEPMPVAIGYHPYFRLHDAPRDDWKVHIPATEEVVLDEFLIPTGEFRPAAVASPHVLRVKPLDDVFTGLEETEGGARFRVEGAAESITVTFGPRYTCGVVFAPPGRDFICFEPMSAPTNAFNLDRAGKYHGLQYVDSGASWSESFRVQVNR